jgi:hypothetical protein
LINQYHEKGFIMKKVLISIAIALSLFSLVYTSAQSIPIGADASPLATAEPQVLFPGVGAPPDSQLSKAGHPLAPTNILQSSSMFPNNKYFPIADTTSDESDPVVAAKLYGAIQYLVVYEKSGDIYGQRMYFDGSKKGSAFTILHSLGCIYSEPDVSDALNYGHFMVVAQYECVSSKGIELQAVNSETFSLPDLLGSSVTVASSASMSYHNPAIACTFSIPGTCLIVYTKNNAGSKDIQAWRITDNYDAAPTLLGNVIDLATGPGADEWPDVAWGGPDHSFLVAWSYYYDMGTPGTGDDRYALEFNHLYDTDQGGSPETYHVNYFMFGTSDVTKHQIYPTVAYNPYDTALPYVVTFQYDYNKDGSDYDIRLQAIAGSTPSIGYTSGVIVANSVQQETEPVIAYATGEDDEDNGNPDQYLVTFTYTDAGTYSNGATFARQIIGEYPHSPIAPKQLIDYSPILSVEYSSSHVIAMPILHRFMIVWEKGIVSMADTDWNVYGALYSPYAFFIPMLIKP